MPPDPDPSKMAGLLPSPRLSPKVCCIELAVLSPALRCDKVPTPLLHSMCFLNINLRSLLIIFCLHPSSFFQISYLEICVYIYIYNMISSPLSSAHFSCSVSYLPCPYLQTMACHGHCFFPFAGGPYCVHPPVTIARTKLPAVSLYLHLKLTDPKAQAP